MPPLNKQPPARGKTYWRSLDDLAETPELRELVRNEFPAFEDRLDTAHTRRTFLKLMGASTALAGLAACRWPVEEIVPFAHRPEGYVPGTTRRYATSIERSGVATGLLVTSYDGRPIKIEGNPNHPSSLGATSAIDQASILDLYDPDRSRTVFRSDGSGRVESTWAAFAEALGPRLDAIAAREGRGLHVLAGESSSRSLASMRERLARRFPGMRWHTYEPTAADGPREGARHAFGEPYRVQPDLEEARVIVSLDEDLLLTHPSAVRFARDYSRGRAIDEGRINRLYVVESTYTVTGTMADQRLAVPAAMAPAVAGWIAAELFLRMGLALPAGFEGLRPTLDRMLQHPLRSDKHQAMARDLMHHRGRSLIVAGPRQPAEVHALVHLLNAALGNAGRTVHYTPEPGADRGAGVDEIRALAEEMQAGVVDVLLILGGNPVFDAPVDIEFERLLSRVGTTICHGLHPNETAAASDWHLPAAHPLESWSDSMAWDGTAGVSQPLIAPLWGGKTPCEVLALFVRDGVTSGYDIVRRTFEETTGGNDLEGRWRRTLHDGLIDGSAWATELPEVLPGVWMREMSRHEFAGLGWDDNELEIVFRPDPKILDGGLANNGWLQELPDSITKVTWDNPALIAPSTAKTLGVTTG
ncbi:MAG: TAT-variant-translocated molybdopterin oxidoreductase, partial [Acidobacteriota bacterium]|nr:TAT-variant-translocated molybdopterin oxidoreductase [Acidobacteriota bacterium]